MSRSRKYAPYHLTTLIAVALSLLILFTSVGYFFLLTGGTGTDDASADNLQKNQALWQQQRPAAFRYTVQRSCICPREFNVAYIAEERAGERSAAFGVTVEAESGDFLEQPPEPVWVDDIFEQIAGQIRVSGWAAATYDARYGFPNVVTFDRDGVDDDILYEIRDFEVLEHRE